MLTACLAAAALLLVPHAVGLAQLQYSGTEYTVTTLVDEDDGNLVSTNGTGTSLREAVLYSAAADRVIFSTGLTGTIYLLLGELVVSHDLIIKGPGQDVIELNGNDLNRILSINTGVGLEIEDLTLASGREVDGAAIHSGGNLWASGLAVRWSTAIQRGGAIYHSGLVLAIAGSRFEHNDAYMHGGAIAAVAGTVGIAGSSFEANTAGGDGGAMYLLNSSAHAQLAGSSFVGNTAVGAGGALSVASTGSVLLTRCTFEGNRAGYGGGISNAGTLDVTTCTVSGNNANSQGGGIRNSGTAVCDYSTIARNHTASGGGISNSGTVNLSRTIVAENSAASGMDFSGTVSSGGNNLVRIGGGSSGWIASDLVGTDADPMRSELDDLRLNGGATKTHALMKCSRAIDAAVVLPVHPVNLDQRGAARAINGDHDSYAVPDIGAFEVLAPLDNTAPVINSNPVPEVYLDSIGHATITAGDLLLGAYDDCKLRSTSVSKTSYSCADVGDVSVSLTATDHSYNTNTVTLQVHVVDDTPPILALPADVTASAGSSACSATLTAAQLGSASAWTTCGGATIENDAPATFPVGITSVTWTATDASGNVATGVQTVTINDVSAPVINGGNPLGPISVNTSADGCSVALEQVPLVTPTVTDNCVFTVTNNAPGLFPLGATTVTWTAKDASNNTSTSAQTVTVIDATLPVIYAPPDLSLVADANSCTRDASTVDLGSAVSSDNCSVASVTNDKPASFPIGITSVIWTATDGSGNFATATQHVTVYDAVPPTISAPDDIEIAADLGECYWTVDEDELGDPTNVSDNCPNTVGISNSAGGTLAVGTHRIIWTAMDNQGNRSTDVQIVTITGDEPTIDCPSNITDTTDTGQPGAIVFYNAPTAGSECSAIEIIRTGGLASGDFFPVGTTTVSYMAIDGSNQIALCSFTVTIVDEEFPRIAVNVAPLNLWPADNKMNEIKATIDVRDNVPGASAVLTSITCNQNASGDIAAATLGTFDLYFELRASRDNGARVYTITYTATDVALNVSSASAVVTVPTTKPKEFEEVILPAPSAVTLAQNYPNPFNPSTVIGFGIPAEQFVELRVFNAMGMPVRTLVGTQLAAGTYNIEWDGRDSNGIPLPSGVYLCMLRAGADQHGRKMILVR